MPEHALEKRRKPSPFIPPTPPPTPYTPETRQRIMGPEKTPTPPPTPVTIEKKAAKEAVDAMGRALRGISGVTPRVEGERVGFHAEANSVQEMIEKLTRVLAVGYTMRGKTMCDGEPVRIT